jgi:hypothetical protein
MSFLMGGRERAAIGFAVALVAIPLVATAQPASPRSGREVYEATCINCHGPDGRAGVNPALEAIAKPPDFTNCAFASREPDRGFLAVAHNGGPARGFSPLMAPWGGMYTEQELAGAVKHLRTFCQDAQWPRGELNLPRPFVTAKAFPEDEAVVSTASQSGSVVTKFIYERRFGALNQFEIILPISTLHGQSMGRATGVGDMALELKRTLAHSLARGNIVSATAELVLPTGDDRKGLGSGTAAIEPFVTFGQILPRNAFFQGQAGVGIPLSDGHDKELFWRIAVGQSLEQGRFGRLWSPMIELLAARPLVEGAAIEWDLLPGVQVTLNARQHVRLAAGFRIPVSQNDVRKKSVITYLLWDWYEGGFHRGW